MLCFVRERYWHHRRVGVLMGQCRITGMVMGEEMKSGGEQEEEEGVLLGGQKRTQAGALYLDLTQL